MNFSISDDHQLMQRTIRKLLAEELPPERLRELDEAKQFPDDTWRLLGEQGWLGLPIPAKYGGSGGTPTEISLVSEALSYGCTGLSAAFQRSCCYGSGVFGHAGTEEQRRYYLPKIAAGTATLSIGITEPEAGSDVGSIRTTGRRDGGGWVLRGQKTYSSGADSADWVVIAARTSPEATGTRGLTTFVVPTDSPGMEIRPASKVGNWMISACDIFLDDVHVPDDAVIGEVGNAWQTTMNAGLDAERIAIASHCVGSAQRVFDAARGYAESRFQFGGPITRFQLIKQKLVDMENAIEAARLLTYQAAWQIENGYPSRKAAARAKLVASETWKQVADEALQVAGGHGYMMESEFQRHYRDARLYTIGGGTSEIMRLILAKEMGL